MKTTFLQIGECIVTKRPMVISTVLGSCVSATFFHPSSGFSAMFHAMLPSGMAPEGKTPCRYVDASVYLICGLIEKAEIRRHAVEVKLFGGSRHIDGGLPKENRIIDVGGKNIETARRELCKAGFSLGKEDVGGTHGRKVLFFTTDGSVLVKRLGTQS